MPYDPFSGDVFVELTFVNAVVVVVVVASDIVGRGLPITPTTAAAIPPFPPVAPAAHKPENDKIHFFLFLKDMKADNKG